MHIYGHRGSEERRIQDNIVVNPQRFITGVKSIIAYKNELIRWF